MNKKTARIVALLVAAAVAFALWYVTRPAPPSGGSQGAGAAQGTAGGGAARTGTSSFDPMAGFPSDGDGGRPGGVGGNSAPDGNGGGAPGGSGDGAPVDQTFGLPKDWDTLGTAVEPGREVSVAVPWTRVGEGRLRYEINDLMMTRDRATGQKDYQWWIWHVVLQVVGRDDGGATRLRLVMDDFRYRGLHPRTGLPFEFDSRVPDASALDDPQSGRLLRPVLAVLGVPAEFHVDAVGRVVDTDGLDTWRDRFREALQRFVKGPIGDGAIPTDAAITDQWSEYLFPALGGGSLAGGARRPWERTQPHIAPWVIVWRGAVAATRDDPDVFRVDVTAGPTAEDHGGEPSDPSLAKIRVIENPSAYHAAYRIDRGTGGPLEARIDAKYEIWHSRRVGGGMGSEQYAPTYTEAMRRVVVRRTGQE